MALSRLGAVLLAEGAQPLLRPAVRDDALELRQRGADARELRLRLPAAADHAEAARAALREVLRRDAARRAGAQLAELVRLEHRDELGRVGAEEEDDEARAVAKAGVDLRARVAELEVGGGHDRERSALEPQPVARPVLDAPRPPCAGSTPRSPRRRRPARAARHVLLPRSGRAPSRPLDPFPLGPGRLGARERRAAPGRRHRRSSGSAGRRRRPAPPGRSRADGQGAPSRPRRSARGARSGRARAGSRTGVARSRRRVRPVDDAPQRRLVHLRPGDGGRRHVRYHPSRVHGPACAVVREAMSVPCGRRSPPARSGGPGRSRSCLRSARRPAARRCSRSSPFGRRRGGRGIGRGRR